MIEHQLDVSEGIDEWIVYHPYDNGWTGTAKAYETKPGILRAIGEVSDELPFDIELYEIDDNGVMI
jgi:hypothetical protein